MSIIADFPGFFQVFSDGIVKRFWPANIKDPSPESIDGCKSMDVTIDPSKPITARIFVPDVSQSNTSSSLPVLVNNHGGGFCFGSTTEKNYHDFLHGLSITSKCIIISVDYRLAPENRLPAAYDDCFSVLEWLSHNAGEEPWLKIADLSRVFLVGESAGANICHHVALKASQSQLNSKISLVGIVAIHPFFGGEKRVASELAAGEEGMKLFDLFWWLSLPVGADRDFYACNFETEWPPGREWPENFPAVLVCVAENDLLKERGVMYEEFLKKKGVKEVEMMLSEGQQHAFHLHSPLSDPCKELQKKIAQFIAKFS